MPQPSRAPHSPTLAAGDAPASSPAARGAAEPVYYYLGPEWYKGREPCFYDVETLPGTAILRQHYAEIREEIEAFYAEHGAEIRTNFTPYAYRETGWRTINLYSYFLRYPRSCRMLPRTDAVVRSIPGMSLAQVAVLEPHTRIKAHRGDTSAVVRSHLGLVVPGGLPDLGIRVGREERTWKEGDILALQIAHRHYAWNQSDRPRIVLVVDTFRPEYLARSRAIASRALAAIAMKYLATRAPRLKRLPRPATRAVHALLSAVFRARLALQSLRPARWR